MAKNNRESTTLGHHITPKPTRIKAAPAEPKGKALAELMARELAAADERAKIDDERMIAAASGAPFYDTGNWNPTGPEDATRIRTSADPASIVGLDAFVPGSDTATDGDPKRTDPDPS